MNANSVAMPTESEKKLYSVEGLCVSHLKAAGSFLLVAFFFSYYACLHMGRKSSSDELNFPIFTMPVAVFFFTAALRSGTYALRVWWLVARLRERTTTTHDGALEYLHTHLDN